MRKLLVAAALSVLTLVPVAAQAGWLVEGSFGKGYVVSKPRAWDQLNFMVAPGWSPPVLSLLRLQLGIVADFADTKGSKFDYELRPMLTIAPPLLPLYGRAILAVGNLRGPGKTVYAYGAAAGLRFGLGPIGIFGEVGALPRSVESKFIWEVEGRAGAYLEF